MSLCSELENINISVSYFYCIKDVFSDYMQYIINYKSIINDYIRKLSAFNDKYSYKLLRGDDNIKYKNLKNINHLFSLTSPIPKIIEKQIENLKIFIDGISNQIDNNNKIIKEKEILSNKFQTMFEESRKDLLKKYKEIDKLRDIYITNMSNTEDTITKYLNNNMVTKEQMKNIITQTKKIEKEYRDLINSTKLYEETFDSLYLSSLENFKKLSSETSNLMKDSIMDFILLLQNNKKMQLIELEMHFPDLNQIDEIKEMENIITSSYSKNNKLVHVKPKKYKLKIFQKKSAEKEENQDELIDSPIFALEDGFEEMMLITDENIIKTMKIMKENFELFGDNNLNIEIEEEKLKCMLLTQKIFNIENPKLQNEIPTQQEIDELNKLLDKHHNRVVSLQQMSGFRNRGQFEISQKTFDILTMLFNTMINTVKRDSDFHVAENATILSQTYYLKGEKPGDKIYLLKMIQNNEIFKSKQFWEDFLEFSINKGILKNVSNDVKNGNILKENRKEAEDKMGNIAFGQIISFNENMRELGLGKELINEVILPKIEKYRMSKELIEQVKDIINNKK